MQSTVRKWGPLVVLSLALAIIVIDTTLLNVALGTIIRDLNTDIQSIQWVITLYSLVLAAFTITGGRLGDFFGRKRMFVLGAIIFAAGSLLASFSHSVGILILGEAIIEGLGAVLMLPATSSLLVSMYRGRDRAVAFGVWGGIAAAASAIGPILGGYLTTHYSWRWGFRINVFVVIILILGSFFIKEAETDLEQKPTLDWIGVVLSSLGLLGIVFGIIEASRYGWWKAKEVFMIGSHAFTLYGDLSVSIFAIVWGLFFLLCFLLWEAHVDTTGRTPLVSMHLFQKKQFSAGVVTAGVLSLGMSGLIFTLPVFYQSVRGLDALHTGFGLLSMSIAILVAAPFSSILVRKIIPKWLVIIGLSINIVAYLLLAYMLNVNSSVWSLAPGLALFGFGIGLIIAQISNITLSAVSVKEAGEASGVNNTMRQLGSTLGSAIIGSILISTISSQLAAGIKNSSVIPENMKTQIAQAVGKQTSNVEFGGGAHLAAGIPQNVSDEITSISHEATVKAGKYSFLYSALISLLGILVATQLPSKKNIEEDTEHTPSVH